MDCKEATVNQVPEELTLRIGETRGQKVFVDTTRIDRNKWSPPLVDSDWSEMCQTLLDGVEQEDWDFVYNTFRAAAKKVGIKKRRERADLLWKLTEKKGAGETFFDENLKGQLFFFKKKKRQERKTLWEEWVAPPVEALRICGEKAEGGAEDSSTYCSLDDPEIVAPYYMEEQFLVW